MSKEYVAYNIIYNSEDNHNSLEEIYNEKHFGIKRKKTEHDEGDIETHYVEYTDGRVTDIASFVEGVETIEGTMFPEPEYLDKSIIGKTKEEAEKILSDNIREGIAMDEDESFLFKPKYSREEISAETFKKAKINEIKFKCIQDGAFLSDLRFLDKHHNIDKLEEKAQVLEDAVRSSIKESATKLSADDIAKIRFNAYKQLSNN